MLWTSRVHRVAGLVISVMVAVSVLLPATEANAAEESWTVERLDGADRFATSIEVAKESYPGYSERVYVAYGYGFPDALAAGGGLPGPVLLTKKDSVPANVLAEIVDMNPEEVFVVGGPAVISDSVVSQLDAAGSWTVKRLAGADRFATSVEVSREMYPSGAPVVHVAFGYGFPDALAAAGGQPGPILLSRKDSVPASVIAEIQRLNPLAVLVAGGPAVISATAMEQLDDAGPWTTFRDDGTDRFGTSVAVSARSYPRAVERVYVAFGYGFPDALAAGGALPGPVLLTRKDSVPGSVIDEIQRLGPSRVFVVGGPAVISDDVVEQLRAADPGVDEAAQRAALVAFYNSTGGPGWTNDTGWLTNTSYCTWFGLECAPGTSSVTGMFLRGNNLIGPIPNEIGVLKSLVRVDLTENHLYGQIPAAVGALQRLTLLGLGDSHFTGSIPNEVALRNLRVLSLAENDLTGPIPALLGMLPWIEYMHLSDNHLIGPIPPTFGRAVNVRGLSLQDNQLSGPIPPEIGRLANLEFLGLDHNNFIGPIPPELGDLHSLRELMMSYNHLSGIVPSDLLNLDDTLTMLELRAQSGCLVAEGIPVQQWLMFMDPQWNDGCP